MVTNYIDRTRRCLPLNNNMYAYRFTLDNRKLEAWAGGWERHQEQQQPSCSQVNHLAQCLPPRLSMTATATQLFSAFPSGVAEFCLAQTYDYEEDNILRRLVYLWPLCRTEWNCCGMVSALSDQGLVVSVHSQEETVIRHSTLYFQELGRINIIWQILLLIEGVVVRTCFYLQVFS